MSELPAPLSDSSQQPKNVSPTPVVINIRRKKNKKVSKRIIYKTPFNCFYIIMLLLFFTGFFIWGIYVIYQWETISLNWLYIVIIVIAWAIILIIAFICGIGHIIDIDKSLGVAIITKRKLLWCFNKTQDVKINEIKEVIIETDYSMRETIGRRRKKTYYGFQVTFILSDGESIEVLSGVFDKAHESNKCFKFLKRGLPQSVNYSGNLAY